MSYMKDINQAIFLAEDSRFKMAWGIMQKYYNGLRDEQYNGYVAQRNYKHALLILNQDWAWKAEDKGEDEAEVAEASGQLWRACQ